MNWNGVVVTSYYFYGKRAVAVRLRIPGEKHPSPRADKMYPPGTKPCHQEAG